MIGELFNESTYCWVLVTLALYEFGLFLNRKLKRAIVNPILICTAGVIAVLRIFRVDYAVYKEGTVCISYLLTPTTVCLAIPLYEKLELLKQNKKAVIVSISAGVLTSLLSVFAVSKLFSLPKELFSSLVPKSITTAIGISISEELGGLPALTAAVIILTGILGNIAGETFLKLAHVEEPVAKGLAFGNASHAIGTSRAMEIGKTEGAMSSLSIVVAGIMTVILAPLLAKLY